MPAFASAAAISAEQPVYEHAVGVALDHARAIVLILISQCVLLFTSEQEGSNKGAIM